MVRISLFGIDNIETFHKTVKEAVFFEKGFEEKGETIKVQLYKIKKTSQQIADALSEHSKLMKGINTALSISWQDFFTVNKEIDCYHNSKKCTKRLVLILDDFERTKNIDKIELMGAINEYSENQEIKIILIADEEHIQNDEYKEFTVTLIDRYDMVYQKEIMIEKEKGRTEVVIDKDNYVEQKGDTWHKINKFFNGD